MTEKTDKKTKTERYLKLPNHILNLPNIRLADKVLLAHFYGFGEKGCWQSNATLAQIFMTSPRMVSRSISVLRSAGLVLIKAPKGTYRTIWAKSYPDVKQQQRGLDINGEPVRQKVQSGFAKNGIPVRNICPTINNNTIKENNRSTTAPPPPLPACGQASAVLDDRRAETLARVEQFKRTFGRGAKRAAPMSQEEFQRRKQQQIKALLVAEALSQNDKCRVAVAVQQAGTG